MSCCAPGADATPRPERAGSADEILLASRRIEDDLLQTDLSVPSAHCGGCIAAVERALSRLEGVVSARLNLTTRRATVQWRAGGPVPPFIHALADAGYEATLSSREDADDDPEFTRLVRATAVAGFAAMNIMLLSVSVWAGAGGGTRHLFHSISALIAFPVVAYSGRVFFQSAWSALRSGRTNMDVPISVGILLALALSAHDTYRNEPHAYFDAVTTLVFFLLVGRTLDHMMRRKARSAVMGLARLMPRGATVLSPDGTRIYKPLPKIEPGEQVLIFPGDRVPLDGIAESGTADMDVSLVTGEASPAAIRPGAKLVAGMLNLDGSLVVQVTRGAADSFVADMVRLMEAAGHGRARYRRLADRMSALYSPIVHSLALLAFVGWMLATGDWHRSLTVAISVLIITCPCAVGLAVPMVQVMAARRLFERGIALKDGSALERLAEADAVVFDKTGTLTSGTLHVTGCSIAGNDLDAAVALAVRSRHPVSQAVAAMGGRGRTLEVEQFTERSGAGIEGRIGGDLYRLGRPDWSLDIRSGGIGSGKSSGANLSRNGVPAGFVEVSETIRPHAREAISELRGLGLEIEMLSGDRPRAAASVAASLGIETYRAALLPRDKIVRLEELRKAGRKTFMVGDGLNDAPALAAAHVSMAPSSASDIGRTAADLVFFGSALTAVPIAVLSARTAGRLVHQNLLVAAGYNILVIPIALAGAVTPLAAAIAMSLSSMLVTGNALRFPMLRSVAGNQGIVRRSQEGAS